MNHQQSHFKIRSENENGYIGVCECCCRYNVAYKTILLTFDEDELHRFFEWLMLNRLSPGHYPPVHHDRTRMFSSLHSNLFFVFTYEELGEVCSLYEETEVLIEVQRLLLPNRMNYPCIFDECA